MTLTGRYPILRSRSDGLQWLLRGKKTKPSQTHILLRKLVCIVLVNPFSLFANPKLVPTEAEIRLRLQEDERRAIADGKVQIHEMSATSMLATGLVLEESQ
jgi:hypothetical protein